MSDAASGPVLTAIAELGVRLGGQIAALDGRLSGQIAALDARIAQLDTTVDGVRTELGTRIGSVETTLGARIDAVGATTTRLEARLDRVRGDVMDRIDRLQDGLTQLTEGMIVDLGAAERAEQIAKSSSEETRTLGQQMTRMVRRIRRVEEAVKRLGGDAA